MAVWSCGVSRRVGQSSSDQPRGKRKEQRVASQFDLERQVSYARDLVRQAERGGLIDRASARDHLRNLGEDTPAAPAGRTVTITLRATGAENLRADQRGQMNTAIERALGDVARYAGVRVEPGSVRVDV